LSTKVNGILPVTMAFTKQRVKCSI
jgi:hypothetical protein